MGQLELVKYDEATGVGDLLFVNTHQLYKYRFYRRINEWDECYMVEFFSNSKEYHFYWGLNELERGMVDVTALLSLQDSNPEWKRIKFQPLLAYNLPQILDPIEKEMAGYEI